MTTSINLARSIGHAHGRDDGVNGRAPQPRPPLDLAMTSDDALTAYQRSYATGHQAGRDMRDALLRAQDLRRDLERMTGRDR